MVIMTAGTISGGGFNPAVAFGLNLTNYMFYRNSSTVSLIYAYIMGPLMGAVASGIYFKYFHVHYVTTKSGAIALKSSLTASLMGNEMVPIRSNVLEPSPVRTTVVPVTTTVVPVTTVLTTQAPVVTTRVVKVTPVVRTNVTTTQVSSN